MELQLHEQYAINNNSNLNSIIVLIVALLSVFYGFGYVYIHSNIFFSSNSLVKSNDMYCLDELILTTIATIVIIYIIRYICLYQGCHQRLEQFIIYSIRCKYYRTDPIYLSHRVFPKNYHPFKKLKNNNEVDLDEVCQGVFGELTKILKYITFGLLFMVSIKIFLNIYYFSYKMGSQISSFGILWLLLLVFVLIFCYGCYECQENKLRTRYKEYLDQYEKLNPYKTTKKEIIS